MRRINNSERVSRRPCNFGIRIIYEWMEFGYHFRVSDAAKNINDYRKILTFAQVLIVRIKRADQRAASRVQTRDIPNCLRNKQLRCFYEVHKLDHPL